MAPAGLIKLATKLKRLKKDLKGWNKSVFGWNSNHIQCLEAQINELEFKLQNHYIEDVELDLLASKAKLDTGLHREEVRLS